MQKEEQKLADEIVISDTCCLISFEKINKLYLLNNLYNNIYITPDVLNEYERGGSKIPSFIKIKDVKNTNNINNLLSIGLHIGEASSIALYNECKNPLLVTDDSRAREYAMDAYRTN
jgi:predicted nucleic acid-binding protein